MPHSFSCSHYHLVFSTKGRLPTLTAELRPRLYEYLGGVVRGVGGVQLAAGGMPDHVHPLVSLGRRTAMADALREIKANSSKWIHETFPASAAFAWRSGYGAFAVSYSHLGRVRDNLANQAEHHRTVTFQEEYRAFLERHDISYEERHLWD